ncbi:PH domain-containing protein [Salipaludibacillus sp. CF4.18]|uniref:PH domain-containing protein n=1 Tax=Salipaludibacillus sp. CF4.18 TaxID=3373081 RepID=UPI003EE745E4
MNDWKRQHPASIFISFINNVKQMIITFIAIFIFGQSQITGSFYYLIFFGAILLFSIGSGFIGWWKFKYILRQDELQIKQGLIFRKNRFIRKDRIQSIDINAKLLQRLFGLVEVRIETAGGGNEPEFRIVALRKEEAEQIKKQLLKKYKMKTKLEYDEQSVNNEDFNEKLPKEEEEEFYYSDVTETKEYQLEEVSEDKEEEEEKKPEYQWELGNRRLFVAALTSSGVGIAATFIAAIMSQAPQFLPDWLFESVIGWFLESSVLLIGGTIVFVLLTAWLFTLVGTLLKYGLFKLTKIKDEIHISRGVIDQRQLTLNASRITAVRIVQSPLRQLFRYVSVYVESAGGGTKEEDLSTVLIPLCKRMDVPEILNQIIPDFAFTPTYEGIPKESLRRYMIKLIVPPVVVAGVATYFLPYGWIAFVLPIVGAVIGYFQYKSAGISQHKEFLCIKSRVISKTEVFIPRKRIQDMESTQNVLQKLDQLYTIHVSVLTSMMGKTFSLRHISLSQIEKGHMWYSYQEEFLPSADKKTSTDL